MELLLKWDQQLFQLINETIHNSFAFTFFSAITNVADIAVFFLTVFFVYALIFKPKAGSTKTIFNVLTPVFVVFVITVILKLIFQRPGPEAFVRPWPEFSPFPWHYAFPSGHTSRAFAFAAVLGQQLPMWRWPLLGAAALISFSRIYIGAHYPADVIAGAALGVFITLLFVRYQKRKTS